MTTVLTLNFTPSDYRCCFDCVFGFIYWTEYISYPHKTITDFKNRANIKIWVRTWLINKNNQKWSNAQKRLTGVKERAKSGHCCLKVRKAAVRQTIESLMMETCQNSALHLQAPVQLCVRTPLYAEMYWSFTVCEAVQAQNQSQCAKWPLFSNIKICIWAQNWALQWLSQITFTSH